MTTLRRASGHSMIELLVAMVVLGIVGAAIVRLIVTESRSFARQDAAQEARKVSRAAVNLLNSELRMVEVTGGMVAASATSITVRIPYGMSVSCSNNTLSTMPVDSLMFAQAVFGGYALRDSTGVYTYVTSSPTLAAGTAATCTSANITTLTGGKVLQISPALPTGAKLGNPVFLFQTVTYYFGASALFPGRRGLYRLVAGATSAEEIAAPFDSTSSGFRFFVLNADTSQAAAPSPLSNTRGIELVFTGASRYTPRGRATPATAPTTTAVFFQNRLN